MVTAFSSSVKSFSKHALARSADLKRMWPSVLPRWYSMKSRPALMPPTAALTASRVRSSTGPATENLTIRPLSYSSSRGRLGRLKLWSFFQYFSSSSPSRTARVVALSISLKSLSRNAFTSSTVLKRRYPSVFPGRYSMKSRPASLPPAASLTMSRVSSPAPSSPAAMVNLMRSPGVKLGPASRRSCGSNDRLLSLWGCRGSGRGLGASAAMRFSAATFISR